MRKYRMILIFDRIFHIKAFYSQIWHSSIVKEKKRQILRKTYTLFDVKDILSWQ